MKPTSYHHHFLIPVSMVGYPWDTLKSSFPYLTTEELLTSYFSNLAFMMEEGWVMGHDGGSREEERFREAVHMLVSLVVSDVEGMGSSPAELDLPEVDAIVAFVKLLTWDLWVHVHSNCWDGCHLAFVRIMRDAVLVAYHGRVPFQSRDHNPFLPALLSDM